MVLCGQLVSHGSGSVVPSHVRRDKGDTYISTCVDSWGNGMRGGLCQAMKPNRKIKTQQAAMARANSGLRAPVDGSIMVDWRVAAERVGR